MSHELAQTADGQTAMAYVASQGTPWHGLGAALEEGASMDVWRKSAGMDFTIQKADVKFDIEGDDLQGVLKNHQVLYREDTGVPLSVVSNRYKVVQPSHVMDFFASVAESHGFVMDTAGVMFGGRRYWALARTPLSLNLGGVDEVKAHLMLATSCDGTMSTVAKYVATRVVCNNTIEMALAESGGSVKIRHNSAFKIDDVKDELGLVEKYWAQMSSDMQALINTPVTDAQVMQYLNTVFGVADTAFEKQTAAVQKLIERVTGLYDGGGIGSQLVTAKGTAWGLLNSVTEYVDHHYGNRKDEDMASRRLSNAWLSYGAKTKRDAFDLALDLV